MDASYPLQHLSAKIVVALTTAFAGIYGLYNIIAAVIPFDSIAVFGLKGSYTIKALDTRKAHISTLLDGIG